jgi:hypothetical protein
MKKTIGLISIVAIAMALMIAFSGVALASQPVKPTKETETIDITTSIVCSGTVVESQGLSLESSSMNLLDNPPLKTKENLPYDKEVDGDVITTTKTVGEVYGKIKYDEKMIGSSGTTEFDKCLCVDTGSAPNLDVHKQIGYSQGFLGSLSHHEQVGMNVVAAASKTKTTTSTAWGKSELEPWKQPICPFREDKNVCKTIPASCEEVNTYSTMVVTDVQATTETEVGIIDKEAPVILNYKINAKGTGLVVAGVGVYVEDGRGSKVALGSRMAYKEKSIGYGNFTFDKDVRYKSKPPT